MRKRLAACLVAILCCAALATVAAAQHSRQPATRPATVSATAPATSPVDLARQRLRHLTGRAVQLCQQGKFDEAEQVLIEALRLAPDHPTNLYNMACVLARTDRPDGAMRFLQRSCEAGFVNFVHIARDPDLDSLRQRPDYKALMARKDQLQKAHAERALAALRERFGDGYLYELDERARLIFATNTDAQTLADLKAVLLAQANALWKDLFDHKPDQYIAVVLPSAADYRKMVPSPNVGGFYNPEARVLIARRLGQIMTHEFTHALHNADIEAAGQNHPVWITEGLATLYEAATFENGSVTPRDNFRLPYVQAAARTGKSIPLERLLTMTQPQFVSRAILAYGQSGSLLLFLHENGLLRKFYDTYKGTYDQDRTGRMALEQTTGRKLKDLENDWRKWLATRRPPAMTTGPDGAFLGVRFGQENDGLKLEDVVAKGPADTAGLRRGDVIVGMDELDVRDYQSLLPLLAERKPGETVWLRVRRAERYLAVPVVLGRRNATTSPSGR